jgi:hypothetical protein
MTRAIGAVRQVAPKAKASYLVCLGGNQSDAVNIMAFPAQRALSFRWPVGVPLPLKLGLESTPSRLGRDPSVRSH